MASKIGRISVASAWFGTAATSLLFLWFVIPYREGPFLGDDLEVANAISDGTYAKSIQDSLRTATQGKWRPISTLFLQQSFRLVESTYFKYWMISATLLLIVLAVALSDQWLQIMSIRHTLPRTLSLALGTLVIGTSLFAAMGLTGIFGFLEFGALIFCLLSFQFYTLATKKLSRRDCLYSCAFALAASLTHERYIVYSMAVALLLAIRSRRIKELRGMWLAFIGNVVFYIYTAVVVLNADVLKGGGEARLAETSGWWMVQRYFFALGHLFGGGGASALYFDSERPTRLMEGQSISDAIRVGPLLAMGLLVIVFYGMRVRSVAREVLINQDPRQDSVSRIDAIEPFVIALTLLIPAVTVVSRIEARWLFGSLIFVVVGVVRQTVAARNPTAGLLFLTILFLGNASNTKSVDDFNWWYQRSVSILEYVKSYAPDSGSWGLAVNLDRSSDEFKNNSVTIWGLNYGRAFVNYLDNAPNQVLIGPDLAGRACVSPCLFVEVWDENSSRGLSLVDASSQKISHLWTSPPRD